MFYPGDDVLASVPESAADWLQPYHGEPGTVLWYDSELDIVGVEWVARACDERASGPREQSEFPGAYLINLEEVDEEDAPPPSEGAADAIFQPAHYANSVIEPITFINANGIGFNRGNVIKYTFRAGRKGGPEKELEDLRKARRYLDIEIECIDRRRKVAEGAAPAEVWKEAL